MQTENPNAPSETKLNTEDHRFRFGKAFITTAVIVTIGTLVLCLQSTPFYAGLFFVPFVFGPLVVTAVLSFALLSTRAQTLLTISSILYALWFVYIYAQAFYINPDPQSPIAFLFIGIYAVPVLAIFWITAGFTQWRNTTHGSGKVGRSQIEDLPSPRRNQ
ncbi:hypothetical protein [uncultured Gimesia sp.]|uniref:hypothetical protein n=1 Tax=uncultured Gimesia sp. TaxID=1678688 RepID=UPI0030D8733E|tara:strand:- start:95407 stop:95889 length:483 start_codon:yes stop_codon:yes gene_type:complete